MVFALVAAVCGIAVALVISATPDGETTTRDVVALGMPVSVLSVQQRDYPATVEGLGEIVPLWESTIKSEVNGRIVFLSERLQVGNVVKKNELLVRLAKDRLEMAVAEAKSRLAEATVVLLKEEREHNEAKKNWGRSGIDGDPESSLVLRRPQLSAAKSAVKAARAALAHAEVLLGHADIRAPFDGVIVERNVNPGELLFAGDMVASLYDMKTVQVSIHVDAAQWGLLGQPEFGAAVQLHDPLQGASWQGRMVRESLRLEKESRLRTVFLQVDQPLQQSPPLLPGTFVRAVMTGRSIDGLLCIPESALTKQGGVWFVNTENRLVEHRTDPVFYGKDVVYIDSPEHMSRPMSVAVAPNDSFTSGLTVQPIAAKRK
jgi:RND family efflux transporter MFP subunit